MKKLKGIWLALLTVILSVAMLVGTMSIGAFADNITTDGTTAGNAQFVTKLEYGKKTTKLKGAKRVVAPSGAEFKAADLAEFTPDEIGAYTVYYGGNDDNGEYSYVVPCKMEKEYELRVAHNGADIPTYIAEGGKFTVPTASVWYKSDKPGVDYEEDTTQKVYYTIVGVSNEPQEAVAATNREVTLATARTYTVHYYCNIDGGKNYLYKDFTVKAQADFSDTTAPSLSVVSIPREISLNTKYTLPKVTATDNYDENVKVNIEVFQYNKETKDFTQKVKEVTLDENGFAKVKDGAKDVVFENDYNLSFYPTEATQYRITYSAVDDSGNKNTGEYTYTTTAVDKTAPTLKNIDDEQIPTTWGINSVTRGKNEGEDHDTNSSSTEITFPYPEYVDNVGVNTVSFEIRDTVNNKTVIKFSNIYDYDENGNAGSGAKYKYNADSASNGLYQPENGAEITFVKPNGENKGGLKFDFKNYTDHLEEKLTKTGTYTVTYQARDAVPNPTTKTYDITLEDTYTDTAAPSVKVEYEENYILVTDSEEDFVIPAAVVSDEDTRPQIVYELKSNNKTVTVKGGETAKVAIVDNKAMLYIPNEFDSEKNDVELELVGTLTYAVTVTDDAGNIKKVTNESNPITVINANSLSAPTGLDVSKIVAENKTAYGKIISGTDAKVGGFTFTVSEEYRDFFGFEISLYKDGELMTNSDISLSTYWTNNTVHVEDLKFEVPVATQVTMYVRAYNIAGVSTTESIQFTVEKGSDDKDEGIVALDVPVNGNAYTTYNLKNKKINKTPTDINQNRKYIVRQIEGTGKFSLMGTKFTAYNSGKFTFTDGYYAHEDATDTTKDTATNGQFKQFTKEAEGSSRYTLTVTESATPVWNIQGEMPTYTPIEAGQNTVTLPKVVASTDYANARIELAVTGPDGALKVATKENDTSIDKDKDVYIEKVDNIERYKFNAKKDGTYTVTYTAYYGDNEKLTQSYEIKAGDVIAPSFKLKEEHSTRATENNVFKFKEVEVLSAEDKSDSTVRSNIRFKKTLKAPDGSSVYSVDGRGESYRTAETPLDNKDGYKLNKTGVYTVEYVVYDKVGNSSIRTYTFTVSAAKVNNPVSTKIISTILIIVGVLLIAGVILYFVRFRKVKSK